MKKEMIQNRRHLAKALTWRVFGTFVTVVVAVVITGDIKIGLIVGPVDFVAKVILYYLHEKLWLLTKFGIKR